MSWYYSYYIGYKKNGKFYPLAPYDCNHNFYPILEKSRSFSSDLHNFFYKVEKDEISEELKEIFGNDCFSECLISFLPLKEARATCGPWIKTGYCLYDDVQDYLRDHFSIDDLKYNMLSPEQFAVKMQKELCSGQSEDEEHSYKDYIYFSFPDFECKEYEIFMILNQIDNIDFEDSDNIVILLFEG